MHAPFDHGAVTFGPLAAFVRQKTVKTLCDRRVAMSKVTVDGRAVTCVDCAHVEAASLDNTHHLAHVGTGLTQEWRDRFGAHCPCREHRSAR